MPNKMITNSFSIDFENDGDVIYVVTSLYVNRLSLVVNKAQTIDLNVDWGARYHDKEQ
jgi:hypothetical protein